MLPASATTEQLDHICFFAWKVSLSCLLAKDERLYTVVIVITVSVLVISSTIKALMHAAPRGGNLAPSEALHFVTACMSPNLFCVDEACFSAFVYLSVFEIESFINNLYRHLKIGRHCYTDLPTILYNNIRWIYYIIIYHFHISHINFCFGSN